MVKYNKRKELHDHFGGNRRSGISAPAQSKVVFLINSSGGDEGAIADFNKAININPKNLDSYFYRGYAKLMISDLKGACEDWLFLKSSGNLDAKT